MVLKEKYATDHNSKHNKQLLEMGARYEQQLQAAREKSELEVREEWSKKLEIINLRYKQEQSRMELSHGQTVADLNLQLQTKD